ncbi:hypothetical protein BUALT_Bualt11G0058400 [Buddleja alternifolia]|uniref:C3H1-type domain-containing protein n=1 Tax=Buddleja alternifolia TaxID=168488 RepID=A0AAV6WU63_9LAMI|nr:hypothetical protein BUALT_Bualt11G0058400 [Buddleja alternifolia]
MQENTSYHALTTSSAGDKSSASAAAAPPHFNPFLSPTSPTYVNSNASFYSSLFQSYYSNSPSDSASFDGGDTDRRLHDSSCILEYQQLYNRYKLCLVQLHDSIEEVDALRRENETLRLSNADLSHRAALLFSRHCLLSDFNRLSVAASPSAAAPRAAHVTAPAPKPFAEHNRVERRSTERVSLPKSIAVRSSGYLKMNSTGDGDTASHKPVTQPLAASQRVYVPGSKREEEALELDVYNQGMVKTELCNKWEETGACPYGENCQFAHGIKELRPVIRHPRYKTEVCRMVLAGDICPYGHRCHFRHALTDQERLMASPPPR